MALPRLLQRPFRRQPPDTDLAFSDWLDSELGQALLAEEQSLLAEVLPRLTGTRALQVSVGSGRNLLDSSTIPLRWLAARQQSDHVSLCAKPSALPLAKRSLDLLLLHHCLDFEDNPHEALREAVQSLQPGGSLVVVGFQPLGLWGLARLFRLASGAIPWVGRFLRPHRVTDWLQVLACEVEGYESRFHNLPLASDRGRRRMRWLAAIGERLWPQHGAFYILVARKRAVMMRPQRSRFAMPGQVPNVIPVSMARWQRRSPPQE